MTSRPTALRATRADTASPARAGAALLLAGLLLAACGGAEPPPAPPPPQVGALEIRPGALPLDLEYPARLRGLREVEVRARVSGILLEKRYVEGAQVRAGDLLFRIDPAPFQAEVARARAEVGVRRAALEQATRERDRIVPLFDRNIVSRRDHDAALAAYESARAAVDAAQAALRAAELDLSYTEVRAPISGFTSQEARSEGSLVTAGSESSLLTWIVQADRLLVEFAMPADEAARLRAALAGAESGRVGVRVVGADGGALGEAARVDFVAPLVGAESGTVAVRAALDNAIPRLLPGQVVRVRVQGVEVADALVVPKRAVMRGQDGAFVWVVNGAEQAEPRPVRLGQSAGNYVAVLEGLAAGDRVIVDGILKVMPGARVAAMPVAADGSALAERPDAGRGAGHAGPGGSAGGSGGAAAPGAGAAPPRAAGEPAPARG